MNQCIPVESGEDRAAPPQSIVIHPGYSSTAALPELAQATEQVGLDDEGLPPPVKAVSTPTSPATEPQDRRHGLFLRSGLLALFFAPFGFLAYPFMPDVDTSSITTFILVLMAVGVLFIAIGASNGEPRPPPRPRNLNIHTERETSSIYDLAALEQHAGDVGKQSMNVSPTTTTQPTKQPSNVIGIKADDYAMLMVLAGFVFVPLILIGLFFGNPFIAFYSCCFFPEIFLYGTGGKSNKKGGLGSEIHGFWVVLFIAVMCILIIVSF